MKIGDEVMINDESYYISYIRNDIISLINKNEHILEIPLSQFKYEIIKPEYIDKMITTQLLSSI